MIDRPIERITKESIESLVDNKVSEGRTLEYKQELPGGTDKAKKEFLADVSSFANARGGDILYGITEERDEEGKTTGIPNEALGLSVSNLDELILRLESSIRSNLDPRIVSQVVAIEGFTEGPVILIRVQQSWNGPHMVIFKRSSRFFSRTSRGKYQLDVSELRTAFTASEALPERIQRFRDDRLAKIIAGATPIEMPDGAKIVLHLIPISSFRKQNSLNFELLPTDNHDVISPIYLSWDTRRFNIDGYLTERSGNDGYGGYLQVFRDSTIEACDSHMLRARTERLSIRALPIENRLVDATTNYLKLLKLVEIPPPVVLLLTFLNVKGYSLQIPDRFFLYRNDFQVDRNTLILPDILIEDYDVDIKQQLRPVFDALWQAGGWARCLNYDEAGQRIDY